MRWRCRCLNTLLTLLYPKFICKRLLKRVPPMPLKKWLVKAVVNVVGVPFGLQQKVNIY
jgi:hypothetical protein